MHYHAAPERRGSSHYSKSQDAQISSPEMTIVSSTKPHMCAASRARLCLPADRQAGRQAGKVPPQGQARCRGGWPAKAGSTTPGNSQAPLHIRALPLPWRT